MSLIEVQNVSKHYAAHTALSEVSLNIERGRVFGLLGPNGAGKTTLIRMINYITRPDSGRILFDGRELSAGDIERIGYLPEERGLYRKMKVGEQAVYLARLKGLSKDEAKRRLKLWFDKFDIMPWWDKKVEELSKGMQQKVQFVCTVLHEPELLIFDEPFSGFDPVNAELLKREILALREQGATLIFSTHNMQSVEEICDDIALIDKSRVVLSGSVEAVREQHSQPRYALVLAGSLASEHLELLQPLEHSYDGRYTQLRLSAEGGAQGLLERIPREYELIRLERELPTMHEIFLKTVQHYGE
ncbi:MAG: ABC transporter ATP-binding protein [Porphyromonas sp.]|nr:ABC transporter ATP-binding protein [Porphyromonas sp.]